jgi:DNA-binding transcriptional regulator GbsR (MarR family)
MDMQTTRFTDRMGQIFEAEGRPRIAGRIFGWLLVSDQPRSLDQIAVSLGVSKASASTNARMLADMGVLERVSLPADRHDYYRVSPDLFQHTMAERLKRWQRFTEAVREARRTVPIRSQRVRARLRGYESAYAYMAGAIGHALDRWRAPDDGSRLAGGGARR